MFCWLPVSQEDALEKPKTGDDSGRAKVATFAASWWQPGAADAATDPATDPATDTATDAATAPAEVAPGARRTCPGRVR